MKKIIICLCASLLMVGFANAQIDNSDIDIVQSIFGKSKRLIISDYITLAPKDGEQFWKLYDEYEEKRKAVEKDRLFLLKDYAENYTTLSEAKAGELMKRLLKSNDRYNKLHRVYYKKFEKSIGGLNATTFTQLEIFIQTALQAELQSQLPVVGELAKCYKQSTDPKN